MKKLLAVLAVITIAIVAAGVTALCFSGPVGIAVDKISFQNDELSGNGYIEVLLVNNHDSSFQIAGSNGVVTEFSIRDSDEMFIAGRSSEADHFMTVATGEKIKLRFANHDLPKRVLLRLEIFDWLGRSSVVLESMDLTSALQDEK